MDGRGTGLKTELLVVLARCVFHRTGAKIEEDQRVDRGIERGRLLTARVFLRSLQCIAAVAAQLGGGKAVKVIEQDVIAPVFAVLGVTVLELRAAEASAG